MLALKPVLKSAGISQADLARAVELSPSTIAQLLNKEIWPATPDKTALQARISLVLSANGVAVEPRLFEPAPTASTADAEITMTSEVLEPVWKLSRQAKRFNIMRAIAM
jgi:transcriptional regulator with XRE-family HTH domain